MRLARTRPELAVALADSRAAGRRVALVPTMGALHEGHLALVDTASRRADDVVVSIFVNPLQFGASEDLAAYPRTLDSDLDACRAAGVSLVFAPDVDTIYPAGDPAVRIDPGPLGAELEGAVRPGHFAGMLTVVAKLIGLTRPDSAVFGTKDYQQLVLIRRMVADLCLGVDIVPVETVRAPDGLALSSRNRYLGAGERVIALTLSAAVKAGAAAGAHGAAAIRDAAEQVLSTAAIDLDYLALRDPDLGPVPLAGPARLLVAGRVGTTRLIDNVAVEVAGP